MSKSLLQRHAAETSPTTGEGRVLACNAVKFAFAIQFAFQLPTRPIPCQANSETCSAIGEGLASLLYAR